MTRGELQAQLFERAGAAEMQQFHALNPHLSDHVIPGQMVVLSDPRRVGWRGAQSLLSQVAASVNEILQPLSVADATFMACHQARIQLFLTLGRGALGEVIFSRHLEHIQHLLGQLEDLHPQTFHPQKGLEIPVFFNSRQHLFAQLHHGLQTLVANGTSLAERPALTRIVGVAAHQPVLHWTQAGTPGGVMGYATYLAGVAKASAYLKAGGWVGIALREQKAARKLWALCHIGRETHCRPVKLCSSRAWGIEVNGASKVAGPGQEGVWVALGLGAQERLACALVLSQGLAADGQTLAAKQIYQVTL